MKIQAIYSEAIKRLLKPVKKDIDKVYMNAETCAISIGGHIIFFIPETFWFFGLAGKEVSKKTILSFLPAKTNYTAKGVKWNGHDVKQVFFTGVALADTPGDPREMKDEKGDIVPLYFPGKCLKFFDKNPTIGVSIIKNEQQPLFYIYENETLVALTTGIKK